MTMHRSIYARSTRLAVTLIAAFAASSASAAAEGDLMATQTLLAEYVVCGQQFVEKTATPTVAAAQSACASKLDAYAKSMHALFLNARLAEGASPDEAKAFAAAQEAATRKEALATFARSTEGWIAVKGL